MEDAKRAIGSGAERNDAELGKESAAQAEKEGLLESTMTAPRSG